MGDAIQESGGRQNASEADAQLMQQCRPIHQVIIGNLRMDVPSNQGHSKCRVELLITHDVMGPCFGGVGAQELAGGNSTISGVWFGRHFH